jgi:hypothetical protein
MDIVVYALETAPVVAELFTPPVETLPVAEAA